jgi:hypothetical protein
MDYILRSGLLLLLVSFCAFSKSYAYVNSFELERGKSKNQFAFTSLGQIKHREFIIKTLKGTQSINIRSVSVSVSNSGTFALIMLNDYDYGGIEWFVFNTNTRKIVTEKPVSWQKTSFNTNVIWSDYKYYGEEKYLIIPQAGEAQREYFCLQLESGKAGRIEFNYEGLPVCQLPLLTNNHHWLSADIVSAIVHMGVNPWAEESENCVENTIHQPWMVILNLKDMDYKVIK